MDPCASALTNIGKFHNYRIEEGCDGLLEPWEGRVFCNPPYGSQTGLWLDRMAEHNNGIALVFARTETRWAQKALLVCYGVTFIKGRLHFYDGEGKPGRHPAPAPSMLLAWGRDNGVLLDKFMNPRAPIQGITFRNKE